MHVSLKTRLLHAGAYYTLLVCGLCLVQLLFGMGAGAVAHLNIAPDRLLWMLPYALLLAFLRALRLSTRLSGGLRFALHLCGTLAGFFLFVYLPGGSAGARNLVVVCTAALLCYLFGALCYFLFHRRYKAQKETEEVYRAQYTKFDR